eukprot:TRINITY_DN8976_c0_g3_i2.p1 TRINITY_DN8976_c0_g3~~TRINITY_DN8976_c0_g3_i2.p1  ORF type:complete len:206 (+),score=61.43 TRINITY_DN8976_c0_g3_i2:108-725(+)
MMTTCTFAVAKLFSFVISEERDLAILKGFLYTCPGFDARELFSSLDKQGRGYITKHDAMRKLSFTEDESLVLMKKLSCSSSRVIFKEFVKAVVPNRREVSRTSVEQTVETLFPRLLRKYVDYYYELERKKVELTGRADFSMFEMFQLIDKEGRRVIDLESLSDFMASQSYLLSSEDIYILLNAFDNDKDHKWNLLEFSLSLLPDS